MNTPSESSFIHGVLNDIFEDTFRQTPAALPWHIPKHFLEASIAQNSQRNSSPRRETFFKPGTSFPALPNETSPEQPLRDALLNSVIVLADLLGIRFLLISSRNGGTVQRLRELTDHFHLVVLPVPKAGPQNSPEARLQQHDVLQRLRETRLKRLSNVQVLEDIPNEAGESHEDYEEALQWISAEGLNSLVQQDDDDDGLMPDEDEQVLFLYRSFPGANCVNAFRILNFGLLEELGTSEDMEEEESLRLEIIIEIEETEIIVNSRTIPEAKN